MEKKASAHLARLESEKPARDQEAETSGQTQAPKKNFYFLRGASGVFASAWRAWTGKIHLNPAMIAARASLAIIVAAGLASSAPLAGMGADNPWKIGQVEFPDIANPGTEGHWLEANAYIDNLKKLGKRLAEVKQDKAIGRDIRPTLLPDETWMKDPVVAAAPVLTPTPAASQVPTYQRPAAQQRPSAGPAAVPARVDPDADIMAALRQAAGKSGLVVEPGPDNGIALAPK